MVSEESLNVIAKAYNAMSDRDNWSRIIRSYARTFEHRWVNERIVHPLPIEESRSRRVVLNQCFAFMAWHYHMAHLEGDVTRCQACRSDYSGHAVWRNPFPSSAR